jgi:hypothetical protein
MRDVLKQTLTPVSVSPTTDTTLKFGSGPVPCTVPLPHGPTPDDELLHAQRTVVESAAARAPVLIETATTLAASM